MSPWFEDVRAREFRQTREAWSHVDYLWRGQAQLSEGVSQLALGLMANLWQVAPRLPNGRIFVRILDATIDLLDAEELGEVEPDWRLIESDMSAAVNFRRLMSRRRRWVGEFDARLRLVQRYLLGLWDAFIRHMPESCFRELGDEARATFDVPLIEVLEGPEELIESCVAFAFANDFAQAEMFEGLRGQLRRNLLLASNLSPEAKFNEVRSRLVMPSQAKAGSLRELAERYLAHTPFLAVFEAPAPFSVPDETRFEHGHVLGGTGAGKTQLLQRMIHGDLVTATTERRSVIVIDSQGDMIDRLVRLDLFSPEHEHSLADRLVLIDPTDVEHPPALNLFDPHLDRVRTYGAADRERVLNGVVEMYETMFGAMLGAELTQKQGVVFRYLARLMITIPGATIHTLMRLMEDGRPFKQQMEQLDGSARYFFETEFFHPSFAATKKQILRRLWGVLSTPAFDRMFAQPTNKLDLFEATNDGKIILISTAKELLKRDGSSLLGRFFINLIAQAALERSVLDPEDRTPTFVYVDEAQEYFDEGVETILQQARKYRIGLVAAHQSLDQASPGLRSALLSNTSFKCASGVSARDARVLADELRTTSDFIEGMRRRGDTSDFAAWVKHETPRAMRLTVPLGHLERQPTLSEEELDRLVARNRERYCGTIADASWPAPRQGTISELVERPADHADDLAAADDEERQGHDPEMQVVVEAAQVEPQQGSRVSTEERELGKGGKKHRYLQNLVKGLAEAQGFRATIEAPMPGGQVDVLLERDGASIAVEVSVSTPVEWERQNLRKCLAAGFGRVALVLAKSQKTALAYAERVSEGLSPDDRQRLTILQPDDVPDFIASLGDGEAPAETVVKGYRVKVTRSPVSPEDAKARREALTRLVAQSIKRQSD